MAKDTRYAADETAWSAADETALHTQPNGAYPDYLFGIRSRSIVRLYHNGECTVLSPDEAFDYGQQLITASGITPDRDPDYRDDEPTDPFID